MSEQDEEGGEGDQELDQGQSLVVRGLPARRRRAAVRRGAASASERWRAVGRRIK